MAKCGIAFCQILTEGNNTYCSIRHAFLNDKKAEAVKVRTPIKKVSEKRKSEVKGNSSISKKKKSGVNDSRLWKVFSQFIRLRDADTEGICKCFTCGLRKHWRGMDCGHGIGRQHSAVKYNEKNNHAQCKRCNGFEGGKREIYKQRVNELYGAGTWELLELAEKKRGKSRSQFEVDQLTIHYTKEVEKLLEAKGLFLRA